MPKKRKCGFQDKGLNEFNWVKPFTDDPGNIQCKICLSTFTVVHDGVAALKQHESTQSHKKKVESASKSHLINSFLIKQNSPESDKVAIAELTCTFHCVKHHLSYASQDCLVKVLKQIITDSEIIKKMSIGKTKTSALVNQVIYPHSMEQIFKSLKKGLPFSISTDASNKGNRNFFPVAVQYFTVEEGICFKIMDFLKIRELLKTTFVILLKNII